MNFRSNNPAAKYVFGYQPDTNAINGLGAQGLLTRDTLFNQLIQQRYNQKLNITAQLSPIRDLTIDVNFDKTFDKQYLELYKDTSGIAGLRRYNPYALGSFSISYISYQTLFSKFDPNEVSETFKQFEANRVILSNRLKGVNEYAKNNGQLPDGFIEGYGRYAQDVLIPSFLAAYTNKDPPGLGVCEEPVRQRGGVAAVVRGLVDDRLCHARRTGQTGVVSAEAGTVDVDRTMRRDVGEAVDAESRAAGRSAAPPRRPRPASAATSPPADTPHHRTRHDRRPTIPPRGWRPAPRCDQAAGAPAIPPVRGWHAGAPRAPPSQHTTRCNHCRWRGCGCRRRGARRPAARARCGRTRPGRAAGRGGPPGLHRRRRTPPDRAAPAGTRRRVPWHRRTPAHPSSTLESIVAAAARSVRASSASGSTRIRAT